MPKFMRINREDVAEQQYAKSLPACRSLGSRLDCLSQKTGHEAPNSCGPSHELGIRRLCREVAGDRGDGSAPRIHRKSAVCLVSSILQLKHARFEERHNEPLTQQETL